MFKYIKKFINSLIRNLPTFIIRYLQQRFVYEPIIKYKNIRPVRPPLFDTVFFEVRTLCNEKCEFCSASIHNDIRSDRTMSFNLYKKVILQLKDIKFTGRIAFHVNNEPLLFNDLSNFVKVAKQLLPDTNIQILSNGKSLTLDKASELLISGISELSINHYMKDLRDKIPRKYYQIVNQIIPQYYNFNEIEILGIGKNYINPNAKFRFYFIKRLRSSILTSRGGTAPNKKNPDKVPRGFCQYPFTQFNITTNGSVSQCCCDVQFKYPMGNVNDDTLLNIWNNKSFNQLRNDLLKGNRENNTLCRQCDFYGVKRSPDTYFGKYFFYVTQ